MRQQLHKVFEKHFTPGQGGTETMMALFGAAITVRDINSGKADQRTLDGVNEMLFSFSVGLPLGNAFWQRASVLLFPLLAAALLDLATAAEYLADEKNLSPDDPRAAELRRKASQCMGGYYTLATVALVADRGLSYAQKHSRELRDELSAVMEQ